MTMDTYAKLFMTSLLVGCVVAMHKVPTWGFPFFLLGTIATALFVGIVIAKEV